MSKELPEMFYETIELRFAEGVAHLTLNRPEVLNALNLKVGCEIIDACRRVELEGARCLLLTGRGRAFCAGGDLKAMAIAADVSPSKFFDEPLETIHQAVAALFHLPIIVIAAINGFATGAGMNLALSCDLRVAAESARFGQAFVGIGAIPDCGGTYLLPRIVGWAKAAELMLTGEMLDAREAERLRIVSRVVADEELEEAATKWARTIASGPTASYARIKRLLHLSAGASFDEQLEHETRMQRQIGQTTDFVEGIAAFLEKRKPEFCGR